MAQLEEHVEEGFSAYRFHKKGEGHRLQPPAGPFKYDPSVIFRLKIVSGVYAPVCVSAHPYLDDHDLVIAMSPLVPRLRAAWGHA